MKKSVIFTHDSRTDAALLEVVLRERGFEISVLLTKEEKIDDVKAAEADFLLVMGGPMGVYEAQDYPFLKTEIRIIRERLEAQKPMLGICLGSQLMAAALGEKVYKGPQGPEFGWLPIKITEEGRKHPARHLDGIVMQSHGDTFDLPRGAALLASSLKYANQAFSYGRSALAIQCHPEVTRESLSDWRPPAEWLEILSRESGAPWSPENFAADIDKYINGLNIKTRKFFTEWLESVGL